MGVVVLVGNPLVASRGRGIGRAGVLQGEGGRPGVGAVLVDLEGVVVLGVKGNTGKLIAGTSEGVYETRSVEKKFEDRSGSRMSAPWGRARRGAH